ncbi:MAG TPA: ferritin [Candidatus Saccharimonadales bacterium]|nr:ferritin [Candidatus Saccharimonadales bacterium]
MTNKIKDIINKQINEEFYSAYLYLALAAFLEKQGLKGAANWMTIQAKEENDHAMGFFRFLLDRNEEPVLEALAKPDISGIKNIKDVFMAGLKHEQHITECISNIHQLAKTEKDSALESFIKWYVDEQVEEEANAVEIIDKLNLSGLEGSIIYMIDQELKARMYVVSGPYATTA